MSPDIHWGVGDDAEQETIAHASAPRRSRRSWIVILIVVILGAGLGMAYRSLPEPPLRSTPTTSPTPDNASTKQAIPAALFQTIDREAQALADGDLEMYREVHTPLNVEGQQDGFTSWGRPGDDRPLYEIVDFKQQADSQAWADIRQFRNGRYFRITRFYYRESGLWLRGPPNDTLWSGEEENLQTPHFNVTYAIEDRGVLSTTLNQIEEDYRSLCRDLSCAALGYELTFTLRIEADEGPWAHPVPSSGIIEGIRLPSPRVAGFYESGRAYSWNMRAAYHALAKAIVERVHGSSNFDRPGGDLLYEGSLWAIGHIDPLAAKYYNEWGNITQKSLLSLEILWEIRRVESTSSALIQLKWLLRFIEQEYGAAAVTRLLGVVSSAKSMSDAIESGLGIPFAEFEQKWQAWAAQNIPKQ